LNLTPSVVFFDTNKKAVVGQSAKSNMSFEEKRTFFKFKRDMGSSKTYDLDGSKITPTDLSALVLQKLKQDYESAVGAADSVVITVPANFNNEAREATLAAAKAARVRELAVKPEAQLAAESSNLPIETFAVWLEASKQVLADAQGLESAIEQLLLNDVAAAIDTHIYNTVATPGDSTPFTPTTAVAADSTLEIAMLVQASGGTDVVVAVNPADWFKVATAKASTSGVYLGTPAGAPPVIASPSVAAGKVLAFDRSAVVLFERESEGIYIGYSGDMFIRNAVCILAEARAVCGVLDPHRVAFGNLVKP
jgi:hypothetical protein